MNLESLPTKSISDMSDDELYEHLRNLRRARRTSAKKPAAKKSSAAKPKIPSSLSDSDLAELISLLEESE